MLSREGTQWRILKKRHLRTTSRPELRRSFEPARIVLSSVLTDFLRSCRQDRRISASLRMCMKGLTFLTWNFYHDISAGLKNLPRKPQNFGDNWPLASKLEFLTVCLPWARVTIYWSPSSYRTPAVIGCRRIVWRFSTHARIASISLGEGAS